MQSRKGVAATATKEAGAAKLSIHSSDSKMFMETEVKVGGWQREVLHNGFMPDFRIVPQQYSEDNNVSAQRNMEFVQEKVREWEAAGYVEKITKKATCNSPLTVAEKLDSDTGMVKRRLCLDMSRHVNKCLNKHHTKYDDLTATACLYKEGDNICIFDLENQYFHVRLAEGAKQYFGFSIPDEAGSQQAYQFTVMVYGFAAAGAVVTRLIKPLQGYLHDKGIRTSIYMDDGQVVGGSAREVEDDMKMVLDVFQKAGWNIQWAKTNVKATQNVKYLGFHVDLASMEYKADINKEQELIRQIREVAGSVEEGRPVETRGIARILGKLTALRTSHGAGMHVATRHMQCAMGKVVIERGWDGHTVLGGKELAELRWLENNLREFNGRGIRDESADSRTWSRNGAEETGGPAAQDWAAASAGEDTEAWIVKKSGQVEATQDMPGGRETGKVAAGVNELWELQERLDRLPDRKSGDRWTRIVWKTDSRNCYNFLKQGARWESIRKEVLQIKWMEIQKKVMVEPVWETNHLRRFNKRTLGLRTQPAQMSGGLRWRSGTGCGRS